MLTFPPLQDIKIWTNVLVGILVVIGTVLAAPTDEFGGFHNEGELILNDETYVMHIIPSGDFAHKLEEQQTPLQILGKASEHYKSFKGLTFNIYDDRMREAAISLYELLQNVKEKDFEALKEWAKLNINYDMFEYAWRLASLYDNKFGQPETIPHFITKPNYYINGETITKALKIKVNNGYFNSNDAKANQYYRTDDMITINTNYSAWNYPQVDVETSIRYFTEDISLNSYYYGMHLLHPFWMSNEKLDKFNSRQAEHFYFIHRQLLARYILEKEHINMKQKTGESNRFFNPYLIYDNGLPFPVRPFRQDELDYAMKSKDIAIKEYISREIVFMDDKIVNITEENYVQLITKLIRNIYDGIKTAKTVRSLYGYGDNGEPTDMYNPAPSLLHHPGTSLRDPLIWKMMENALKYFKEYTKTLEPYDICNIVSEDYDLLDFEFTKVSTYFNYYQFNINQALTMSDYKKSHLIFTARQKRLNYLPFTFNFTIQSKSEGEAIIRLFLGPHCLNYKDCWVNNSNYFLLDINRISLKKGIQSVNWSPENSESLSFDDFYNLEKRNREKNDYNMFKFPNNLLIPKGAEEGLNFTLFVIITPAGNPELSMWFNPYRDYIPTFDEKPLDFPFHRESTNHQHVGSNFKFYNITIFHEKMPIDKSGYFSNYLY